MYYNSRYYDREIGAFISPDTLVPDATSVFGYNRYMYGFGNPLKYSDPTGHDPCDNGAACGDPSYSPEIQALYDAFQATGPDENYTWEMFYADLLWSTQQAGGNLTTANFAQMPELMETAFNARHGGTAPEGTAPYLFFLALFRPDDLYAAVAQAENQRVAQLTGVLAGLAAGSSAIGDPGCSFTAQTLVATAEGAKAIGLIHTGDKVLAWDEETREVGYYTVTDTQAHLDRTLVYLTVDDETILTTPEHPFYVMKNAPWLADGLTTGRWVPAGELAVGDALHQADGTTGVVQAVEVVTQPQVMYNLTVAEVHTFFVGDGQWLVHNQCSPSYVKDKRTLVSWAKNMELNYKKNGTVPSADEVDELVNLAQQYGVNVRSDAGHPNTPWNVPHLNIGDQGYHVPLPTGHRLAK